LAKLPSHRILALFRGEKEEVLSLELVPDPGSPDRGEPSAFERPIANRFKIADQGRSGDRWLIDTVHGDRLITQGRRPWPFERRRLLILDGTANPEILKEFVPSLVAAPEIRVQRKARVVQVSNTTFYKGRLIRRTPGANGKRQPEPTARLLEVVEFIEKTARKGKTLVVTNKPVRCALTGEDERRPLPISAKYRGADVAHFGNIRGSNDFAGHQIAIILGRDEPTVAAAEQRAMAIWYDTAEPIRRVPSDERHGYSVERRSRVSGSSDGSLAKSGNATGAEEPLGHGSGGGPSALTRLGDRAT
jgi:hypothetical protein